MVGWWWWFNVNFDYLSYILGWKEGERMERSSLSWYWNIVSSSWRFIPPFIFGIRNYLWKSLLLLNNNYWLFLIYCAWCVVVYWCNSYTIVHWSLNITEWLKYKLKKVLNFNWYWFNPLSVSTGETSKVMWFPMGKLVPQLSGVVTFEYHLRFRPVIDHWKCLSESYTSCTIYEK